MDQEQIFYYKQTRAITCALVAIIAIIATCNDRQDARLPTRTVTHTEVISQKAP